MFQWWPSRLKIINTRGIMKNFKKTLNNEQGFVLIVSMMMLLILMIIGIAATNTTTIELQISGNDKLNKQTFYQVEAVVNEAVQQLMDDAEDHYDNSAWLITYPDNTGILTTGSGGTELADVFSDDLWNNNISDEDDEGNIKVKNSENSALLADTQMISVYRGPAPDGSLDMEGSTPHIFDVYGRSQKSGASSIIKVGCRAHF